MLKLGIKIPVAITGIVMGSDFKQTKLYVMTVFYVSFLATFCYSSALKVISAAKWHKLF